MYADSMAGSLKPVPRKGTQSSSDSSDEADGEAGWWELKKVAEPVSWPWPSAKNILPSNLFSQLPQPKKGAQNQRPYRLPSNLCHWIITIFGGSCMLISGKTTPPRNFNLQDGGVHKMEKEWVSVANP